MKWLCDVLAHHAHLDLSLVADRERVAEAILESIPKQLVAGAIASSAFAVMQCRGVSPANVATANDLAREIGNNAAHSVLANLHAGPDDDDPAPQPPARSVNLTNFDEGNTLDVDLDEPVDDREGTTEP